MTAGDRCVRCGGVRRVWWTEYETVRCGRCRGSGVEPDVAPAGWRAKVRELVDFMLAAR